MRRKDFQYKYGKKHHSYDNEKAPYPLSYDKHVLELYVQISSPLGAQYQCLSCLLLSIYSESLDNRLAQYLRGSISFANFDGPPASVLDLGCGVCYPHQTLNCAHEYLSIDWGLGH